MGRKVSGTSGDFREEQQSISILGLSVLAQGQETSSFLI